jgi:hypothetical protein
MRTRGINFWKIKILAELSKPEEKKFINIKTEPKNAEEEQNYEIALFFVATKINKQKLVA